MSSGCEKAEEEVPTQVSFACSVLFLVAATSSWGPESCSRMCGVETEPFDAATWRGFVVEGFVYGCQQQVGRLTARGNERERESLCSYRLRCAILHRQKCCPILFIY